MPNIQATMTSVLKIQAQNTKAWNNVFMMPNAHFMSLANDKKGIKAIISVEANQMVRVEMQGRNKRGKPISRKFTVTPYENVVNRTIGRLLQIIASDTTR